MGRSSQRKGRAAELELCRLLNDHGIPAVPGEPLNYGKEADISGVHGVHCEVKRCETLRLPEWLKQAERDAARFGGMPTLFFRRSREQWHVCMTLDDWLLLYSQWQSVLAGEKQVDERTVNRAEIGVNRP